MLSESDQLVSQTLHHVAQTPTVAREVEEQKPSYFQRIMTRSKQQLRNPEGQQISTTIPEESVVDNSEEFPAIKTAYYFADYILSSERASSDTLAFVDTIQQVRQGIREATRLYVSPAVSNFLDAYPNKRTWAMECLQEVQQTLNAIGTDMDSTWCREEDGGTVASKLKFEWGLKNQRKLLKRQEQLNQCYINLMGAIHVMQTAELCNRPGVIIQEPIYEAPVRPLVLRGERDTLRGPYSRQKHRLGYNYASISSLTLALEDDEDDVETASINSTPVELVGSTPSELSESQNVHDLLSFQTSRESVADSPSLFRRPRASSDHVRQTTISGVRPSASVDSMMGHHHSISFTPLATGIPMIARHYHAASVDIQSHHDKYESGAQRSYVLKNKPSLGDDSIDHILSNMVVKRPPIEERVSLKTQSEPPSSLTRSFTIDHPVHAVQGAMVMPSMATNSAPRSIEQSGNNRITLKELPPSHEEPDSTQKQGTLESATSNNNCTNSKSRKTFGDGEDSTKVSSSYPSSLISTSQSSASSLRLAFPQDESSVCRPSGQRPSQRKSKNIPNTSEGRSEPIATSRKIETTDRGDSQPPVESSNTNERFAGSTEPAPRLPPPPMIVIDDACLPILATETELPEDTHDENTASSAFQQRLQGEMETNPLAGSLERQSSVRPVEQSSGPKEAMAALLALKDIPSSDGELDPLTNSTNNSPAAITANGISASRSNESQEDLVGKKPMTAQAKRRAAHARRMHLAFGNVVDT